MTPPHISIQNGQLTQQPLPDISSEGLQLIYEVFRIQDGKPVFLNDHLTRLYVGIATTKHQSSIPMTALEQLLHQMIHRSGLSSGNVKIEFYFAPDSRNETCFRSFFIPTSYPTREMYTNGVICTLLARERNTPSVKIANPGLRHLSDQIRADKNVYETILHTDGFITEGSRSNIFFVEGGTIRTAPSGMVLEGIMRMKVLEIAERIGIPVNFSPLETHELATPEAAFITGTSPRILPIREIDGVIYQVPHPLVTLLTDELNTLIQNALKQ